MFIVFASMIKSSMKWTWIYAEDVKAGNIFRKNNIDRIRVNIAHIFIYDMAYQSHHLTNAAHFPLKQPAMDNSGQQPKLHT